MKKVYVSAVLITILGCCVYIAAHIVEPEQSVSSNVAASETITPELIGDRNSIDRKPSLEYSVTNRSQNSDGARQFAEEDILVKYEMTTTDCRSRDVTIDMEVRTKTTCTVSLTFDHPYDSFSFEQLMQIYETDAVASYLLGMKTFHDEEWREHFDYETSVNHLYRAAYLSGKAQPYLDMLKSRMLGGPRAPASETALRENYVWYEAGIMAGVISSADKPDWMDPVVSALPAETISAWKADAYEYAENLRNSRAYNIGDSF